MLINVLNGSLKKVAILSNELPNAPSYYNDEFHDYLEQGATTFSFTVAKVINNQLQDYTQFLSDQSYFSFRKNGRDYLMTPSSEQSVHETSTEISFFCVSLDRELINEQANSLTNTASHNIQWYFDQMGLISRTQITIGINEVSNLTRVINYDAQESKLSRLISVINNFNAEFDFVTTLNNDGSLGTVVLNIYKENDGQNAQGVGTKRDDVRLTFGKNIEDVEVDVSDDGFFNAAYMTGADGFSWKNYDFSYKNSDGVEEFYKRSGSEIAYAPLSAKMFPSQLKTDKGDIWTNSDRTTEYKNANDMWGYIVSQFKQYAHKQITYTVTPSSTLVNQLVGDGRPLQKGDTVIIQDDNYMDIDGNVGLILSARVSEIITSDTNPANNKIVFSNYKKLKSEASSDIKAIVSQLVNDATPYFADIATSNGVQFKNGTGSTTLSAHIYKGSATTETTADSYEWSKDGTVVANVQTITVDASGVADKAVYSFKATVGGKVVASQSVTITNVNDGKGGTDGKTSYTHVAWANSVDGTDGFTTVYPNLNLLDGTKDFSGNWYNTSPWYKNGTYGKLTVMSFNTGDNIGIVKPFNIPSDGIYSMSMLVKVKTDSIGQFIIEATGKPAIIIDVTDTGGKFVTQSYTGTFTTGQTVSMYFRFKSSEMVIKDGLSVAGHKIESGSTATPYMPLASEVTTADWPSYIGQYSDFTSTASTDPTKYAPWTVFKGNDGNNGRGIVSSEQKYQLTQTSAKPVDPWDNSVWQTTQPTTTSTNKYLWSITRTTFNLAPLTQDIVEQKAVYGDKGNDGSKGDPGKIVSDTEPTTRFKGLTWKYLGTSDLTASDGTVILSGTEYYWSGTNWILSEINAHNINGNNLTITDGEFVSTITDGTVQIQTEIKDDHLMIYKMDTSQSDITTIELKSDSGLEMTYQNSDTGQYTNSIINLQGIFMQDNILNNRVGLSPGGVNFKRNGVSAELNFDGTDLSSSMPIQAPNTIIKSTQFSVSGIGIRLDRMMSFVAVTFSGQASSTINNSPTIINVLPDGFRPISPYSIDYMVPGNTANNGYIYFNPDGSIRIMATINSGYYIRGTRFYITNDVYPS
ncbi:phage tail protein [Lactococcus lactis]|uniref:phage tail protein n=1 Tax=Lactococcus lactis TaxID=1358 RepID=UPI002657D796|nr:phage tail protein [Lactococcus lactis]WKG35973.1 phage tail protein [Lactococcus lactis subsp. lactis]